MKYVYLIYYILSGPVYGFTEVSSHRRITRASDVGEIVDQLAKLIGDDVMVTNHVFLREECDE